MSRNGSGTYNLPAGQPVVTGTVIDSSVHNAFASDVATALTGSLCANGEKTATANQPMGGFKHTSIADATLRTQYASAAQVQDGSVVTLSAVAGTDTITGSLTPSSPAYVAGQRFILIPANTNTGAVTLNVNGLGAKAVVKGRTGVALVAGDLVVGVPADLIYNGTSFYLQTSGTSLAADGTVAAPSYSFSSDPDTGIYRFGSNGISISAGGTERFRVDGNSALEIHSLGEHAFEDGSVGLPGLTFNNDIDTGIYRLSADRMGFSVGGVFAFDIRNIAGSVQMHGIDGTITEPFYSFNSDTNTGIYSVNPDWVGFVAGGSYISGFRNVAGALKQISADGTAADPFYTFNADPDTGAYRVGADTFGVSTGGVLRWSVSTVAITTTLQRLGQDGAVGTPAYSFNNDPDTGVYRAGADSLGFTVGGVSQLLVNSNAVIVTGTGGTAGALYLQDKSAATPAITFLNDQDLGLYRIGADNLGVSAGNSLVFDWRSAATGGAKVADFGGTLQNVGYREVPQNAQTANYTLVLADSGKHIYHASGAGAGDTYTIPANGSVAYTIGTVLTFVNGDSNAVSIAITTDTMTLAGTTTTGTRSLAQNGVATAIKTTATTWIISGTGLS